MQTKKLGSVIVGLGMIMSGLVAGNTAYAATTIDLYTTGGFGNLNQFHDVGNSAGANISIYRSTGVVVYIDGVAYSAPTGGAATDNVDLVLTNSVGETIVLNAHYSYVRKQVNSGRTHMWVTHWTLESGSIQVN